MAIKSNFLKYGLTIEDAYTRVEKCSYVSRPVKLNNYNVNESTESIQYVTTPKCEFVAMTYASKAARDVCEDPIHTINGVIDLAEGEFNIINQVYAHIKSLPAYAGSIDA
jgi:hypothetical protein